MTSERKFIAENIRRVLLKEYLMKKTERAGFGDLDIQRTPLGTRVTLIAERPGMVIGRKGATIKELTKIVEDDFKFDNPQIEVQEAPNPNLNPQIMAQKLVSALERGWHFRRAGHSTVRQIMAAGAKGCQIIISGKLTGQRHRVEKFKDGHIKFCGEPKKQWMHEGFAVAKKKLGIIGVKVQIMDPNAKLPDEVEIIPDDQYQSLLEAQVAEKAKIEAEQETIADKAKVTVEKETKPKSKRKKAAAEPEKEGAAETKETEPTAAKAKPIKSETETKVKARRGRPPKSQKDDAKDAKPEKQPAEVAPEQAPEQVPEKAPEQVPENAPEQVPEKAPEQVPEQVPDKTEDETAEQSGPQVKAETIPEPAPAEPEVTEKPKEDKVQTAPSPSPTPPAEPPESLPVVKPVETETAPAVDTTTDAEVKVPEPQVKEQKPAEEPPAEKAPATTDTPKAETTETKEVEVADEKKDEKSKGEIKKDEE